MDKKHTIIFLNMGGIYSLKLIYPFLRNLFLDPEIINLPLWGRKIVSLLIVICRYNKVKTNYSKIGGGSPLLINMKRQNNLINKIKINKYICMRYVFPRSSHVIRKILLKNTNYIYLYSTYPQYSQTTTRTSINDIISTISKQNTSNVMVKNTLFFNKEKFYTEYLGKQIHYLWREAKKYGRPIILCSAHGVPLKKILKGDVYKKQCDETLSKIIKDNLNIKNDIVLCYQSKVGPMKWLKPYLIDCVDYYSLEKRPIIIVPISFLVENMETIYELHIEMKERALKKGCPLILIAPAPGDDREFIEGFSNDIEKMISETLFL